MFLLDHLTKLDTPNTTSAVAYSGEGFNVGFEYNMQEGANNVTDQFRKGTSVYGAYDLGDGLSIFGRYDELTSENDWNLDKDGTFMIAGVEKVMTKGVKASLNYQSFMKQQMELNQKTLCT